MNDSSFTRRPALLLEAVVADGLGGAERLVDVARLELAGLEDAARPDAGVAVGLQLLADRELVRAVGVVALGAVDLGRRAELALTWWPTSCAMTYAHAKSPDAPSWRSMSR